MVELNALSACDGLLPVDHGRLTLREETVGAITSLAPFKGQGKALSVALQAAHGVSFPAPNRMEVSGDVACVWTGRDQAFLLGPQPDAGLGAMAAVTDQSDAWAVVCLGGDGAEDVLTRLVPVDLRPAAFPLHAAVRTELGHMAVSIMRIEAGLRIMAFRSMAATLVHELSDAMAAVEARKRLS